MERIKISIEQKDALDRFIETNHSLVNFIHERSVWMNTFKPLKKFAVEQFALLLCGWYEVEPEFKPNDWVVFDDKITELLFIGLYVEASDENFHLVNVKKYPVPQRFPGKYLRHATPEEIKQEKERRWWAKHGREPWELHVEDVLVRHDDGSIHEVTSKREDSKGYHLDYCSINLKEIKNCYTVLLFAENRLDK